MAFITIVKCDMVKEEEYVEAYEITYPIEYAKHIGYVEPLMAIHPDNRIPIIFNIEKYMYDKVVREFIQYRIDNPEKIEEFDRLANENTSTLDEWSKQFLAPYTPKELIHMVVAADQLAIRPLYRIIVKRIALEIHATPIGEIEEKFGMQQKEETPNKESEKEEETPNKDVEKEDETKKLDV